MISELEGKERRRKSYTVRMAVRLLGARFWLDEHVSLENSNKKSQI